jgi:hypothetical protein
VAPSSATIKRLFVLSGNRCAFPKCRTPLVDLGGKVTGQICHIKAASPRGPRHDAEQSDGERHGFDNLLLLCPVHHAVVDADEVSYTVARLETMKATHESGVAPVAEPDDAVVAQLIANISSPTVTDGSIIFSVNQQGGQVAHKITNLGPQPRKIDAASADSLVAELKKYPPERFRVSGPIGDGEALSLSFALERVLVSAGWENLGFLHGIAAEPPIYGIHLHAPGERPAIIALGRWLKGLGLEPKGFKPPKCEHVRIMVGFRPQ